MPEKRYAVVRDGVVENVVLWDGDASRWQPPDDALTIVSEVAEPGGTFDGRNFTPAPKPAPDTELESIRSVLAKADGDVTAGEIKELTLRLARRLDATGRL